MNGAILLLVLYAIMFCARTILSSPFQRLEEVIEEYSIQKEEVRRAKKAVCLSEVTSERSSEEEQWMKLLMRREVL
jgi:hypothetical protein